MSEQETAIRQIITPSMQKAIAKGDKNYVIRYLEREITQGGGLFRTTKEEKVMRRHLWFLMIHLLSGWGMHAQALAWTCLECELFPENTTAFAIREQLKRKLGFINGGNQALLNDSGTWKDIAGMQELKATFERDIILPFTEKEVYARFKVHLPNGILLYGPPGCGKTFFVRKVAERLNFKFMEVKPSDLGSTYVHGGQLEINRVFEEAGKDKPTLLFFDELEALVPNRGNSGVSYHYQAEVNEFLVQLNDCNARGILVVGATNHPRMIDPSMMRPGRFDKKIFVGPPDMQARTEAFKVHLAGRPVEDIQWIFLGEETPFYTFAEIELVVNEAARKAVEMKTKITMGLLYEAILKIKPRLNNNLILKYFQTD